jgi:hypothetical protein
MKRNILLTALAFWLFALAAVAQGSLLVTGIVKDKETRKVLANVNISIQGTNIGTVTNADGVFSLKASREELSGGVVVSHLGYQNALVTADVLTDDRKRPTIWLTPTVLSLDMVNVFGGNPLLLVEQAIHRVPHNYAPHPHLFSAFYRETIQKRNRYIGVSEAVADVYKTDYRLRDVSSDRVQILKGRRLESQKKSDTLAVKIAGGPNLPVYLDVAKNGDDLLSEDMLHCYRFEMQLPMSIDDRMQYVVAFEPRVILDYPLYAGLLYIDQETLTLTRAEFRLDLSDHDKAVRHILRKKPHGLRFKLSEVSYLVTYRYQNGRAYVNYLRNLMRFKCDWKKRLFSSTFTTTTEMVMVDRTDRPSDGIRMRDAFSQRDIFYDVVEEYWNEDFWRDYNIIEPTESLESAVKKLKKQRK